MSLSDLVATAKVTLGSMSQTVRRLEQLAYVTKSRGTQDRRKVLFTLTEAGQAASTASRRHRQDWLNGRLAERAAAERADLLRVAPPRASLPIPPQPPPPGEVLRTQAAPRPRHAPLPLPPLRPRHRHRPHQGPRPASRPVSSRGTRPGLRNAHRHADDLSVVIVDSAAGQSEDRHHRRGRRHRNHADARRGADVTVIGDSPAGQQEFLTMGDQDRDA
jgi:hypothetical protein